MKNQKIIEGQIKSATSKKLIYFSKDEKLLSIDRNKIIKIEYESGRIVNLDNFVDKRKMLELKKLKEQPVMLFYYVSTPINIFPQLGIGFGSNPYNIINFGMRLGVGGQFITAGINYVEASTYFNYRFFDNLENLDLKYIGLRFAFRALRINDPIVSPHPEDSQYHFHSFVNANGEYFDISLYLGWELNTTLSFEVGFSIPIYKWNERVFFEDDITEEIYNDPENKRELDREKENIKDLLEVYKKISLIYFAFTWKY